MARDVQFVRELIVRMGESGDIDVCVLPKNAPTSYLFRRYRKSTGELVETSLHLHPDDLCAGDTRLAARVAHELGHTRTVWTPENIEWLLDRLPRSLRIWATKVEKTGPAWDFIEELLEAITMRRTRVEVRADIQAAGFLAKIDVSTRAVVQRIEDEKRRSVIRPWPVRWLMRLRYARQKHMLLTKLKGAHYEGALLFNVLEKRRIV